MYTVSLKALSQGVLSLRLQVQKIYFHLMRIHKSGIYHSFLKPALNVYAKYLYLLFSIVNDLYDIITVTF